MTVAICMWKRWWSLASLFVIAISLEGLTYATTTYFVTRNRPNVPRLEQLINSDSYPSGHVAASVVLWVVVALIVWSTTTNRLARGAALFMAARRPVVVALSRMYRGMHHPTDAIVGYVIGWACVAIALTAVRTANVVRDRRARTRERPHEGRGRRARRQVGRRAGSPELRRALADAGVDDPLWYEVPKSKKAPKKLGERDRAGADLVFVWGGDGMVQRCIDAWLRRVRACRSRSSPPAPRTCSRRTSVSRGDIAAAVTGRPARARAAPSTSGRSTASTSPSWPAPASTRR